MSTAAIPFERAAMLDALRSGTPDEPFDVLVIGGGITGVGVALDAAARGLRTALVERDDIASGTSSKSSKMIHGGLRYLQNGDVRLVYQALRERRRLMRNAAHLVEILPFMIPILTKDSVVSKKVAKALGSAMWMYDLTGGWRIGKLHRRVSAEQAAAHFPTAHLDKLSAGYLYYDAAADDARLALTVARTAAAHGAVVATRCAVVDVTVDDHGQASGVTVDVGRRNSGESVETTDRFHVSARCIVNAAGVWADEVRQFDESTHPDSIRPAKGIHVTVPWEKVRVDIAVIIPVRSDRRSLFLVPWGERPDGTFDHVYVGTTDTDYDGPLDDPQCTSDDIDYVLTALNEALTETITRDDITGVWAGLRPLVKSASPDKASAKTADLSRQHQVAVSPAGVVRVNGGKLTTYREMAEDTVDLVAERLDAPRRARRSPTRRLALIGATRSGARPHSAEARSTDHHLAHRYGTMADEIRAMIAFRADLAEPLVPGQPYLRAEAVYAVRHEMATTLDDVLSRRTRAHLFDRAATLDAAAGVADLLAAELGWTPLETERQLDDYRRRCTAEEDAGVAHADIANATD